MCSGVETYRVQFFLPKGLRIRRAELCPRSSGGKQSQLSLPEPAKQDHRCVRVAQSFPRTVLDLSLSTDRHPVLNTDDIRVVCDVFPTLSTGKDRLDLLMDWSAVGTLPSLRVVDHDQKVQMTFVIDRHVPEQRLEPERLVVPPRAQRVGQEALVRHDEVKSIGVLSALQEVRESEWRFSCRRLGGNVRPRRGVHEVTSMRKIHMDVVHDVLRALKVVARDHFDRRADRPALASAVFQTRQWAKSRGLAFAEIGENEAVSFVRGIGGEFSHAGAERFRLGRLLDTLSGLVVAPAVIPAANGLPFDPARRQTCQSMPALVGYDVGLSAFTTVERQLLAKDPDRNDCAFHELRGDVNGLPVAAKVAPGQRDRK